MQYTLAVGDINQLDENFFGGFLHRQLLNVLTVLVSSATDELASTAADVLLLGSTIIDNLNSKNQVGMALCHDSTPSAARHDHGPDGHTAKSGILLSKQKLKRK